MNIKSTRILLDKSKWVSSVIFGITPNSIAWQTNNIKNINNIIAGISLLCVSLPKNRVSTNSTSARSNVGLDELLSNIDLTFGESRKSKKVRYNQYVEDAIKVISDAIILDDSSINKRWVALNLLRDDELLRDKIEEELMIDLSDEKIDNSIKQARSLLLDGDITINEIDDVLTESINNEASLISSKVVSYLNEDYDKKDRRLDKILTKKSTGIPIMIILFAFIFWLTITGSNYPSMLLQSVLFKFENVLFNFFCTQCYPFTTIKF